MDEVPLPQPLIMVSSGFLPAATLLESLIHTSNEITKTEKASFVQTKNISKMTRRIRLLSSLFEEIQETDTPLPSSSVLCLTELASVLQRSKILMESCREGSLLWNLMQTECIANQFYAAAKEMARALDILPLSLLNLTADTKEQIELLHRQAKSVQLFIDQMEIQRRDEIVQLMAVTVNNERNRKNKGSVDFRRIRDMLSSLGLRSPMEFEEEISKLWGEAEKQAGTGGLIVVSNINNLISFVSLSKMAIFSEDENSKTHEDLKKRKLPTNTVHDHSFSHIPDDFRCPISLDLMNDPVIVASGHTYDRNSIAHWINTGHHTCPKSGQRLIHMALIPNYALRSVIQQWGQENNVPIVGSTSSNLEKTNTSKKRYVDHISATKAVADAVKLTAEFLVGKLATGSPDIQRQAAYELRLLAKTGMDNRRIIAEVGAIPFLLTLLGSHDSRIQENAVTALLNLSIYENNKILIMAAGALDNVVDVLLSGLTMEAKENAAAAIFSLSLIDDHKIIIGAHPRAITALVGLLGEGTRAGKRDAATALFNLAVFNVNRGKVITAGAIPLLIGLLTDDKAGITDDALAMLALLLGCSQGLEEIRKSRVLVSLLIDLLRFGSSKGKENSITLLLGLCKDGGEEVARKLLMNPRSIPSLQSLVTDGSLKARRKADALLRILNRCCS
ncbi:PREDICTED: U-box domain-containing protein 17-like [Erythranthe guttata]|nr:PREDICTED: U-box domain-containing protein 17-like [Erythranthe guttata]|eukprot:XP_012858901.1 PREDICTED: U-box domain-containing protein 17-like [Erythranthe guttata]